MPNPTPEWRLRARAHLWKLRYLPANNARFGRGNERPPSPRTLALRLRAAQWWLK